MGFTGNVLQWFSSWLFNWHQFVYMGTAKSQMIPITCGVPMVPYCPLPSSIATWSCLVHYSQITASRFINILMVHNPDPDIQCTKHCLHIIQTSWPAPTSISTQERQNCHLQQTTTPKANKKQYKPGSMTWALAASNLNFHWMLSNLDSLWTPTSPSKSTLHTH